MLRSAGCAGEVEFECADGAVEVSWSEFAEEFAVACEYEDAAEYEAHGYGSNRHDDRAWWRRSEEGCAVAVWYGPHVLVPSGSGFDGHASSGPARDACFDDEHITEREREEAEFLCDAV